MSDLVVIDVTQLAIYVEKANQIATVSKMMAGVALQDLIKGQDVAGVLLARAIEADLKAKARLDQAKSIAFLDTATDYLKEKGLKESNGMREMYVAIDPDVVTAADRKAKSEAMVAFFKNKLSILRQAHDDLKKIVYGDSHMTAYEGM